MRHAALLLALLTAHIATAADAYRPLGIGLGDSVYAAEWAATVSGLADRGYAALPAPDWAKCVTSPADVDSLWRACVIGTANITLIDKKLQTLSIPAPYAAAFDSLRGKGPPVLPTTTVLNDAVELDYGNVDAVVLNTRSISKPGQKYAIVTYRLTTGSITSITAGLAVSGTGADAQDPATIALAMLTGIRAGSPLVKIGNRPSTPTEVEQAIRDFATKPGNGNGSLSIRVDDPANPTYGSVLLKQHGQESFEITLTFEGRKVAQDATTRGARSKQFDVDVKALVDQELTKQAPAKKSSTAGF